ncbi:MAG: COP23 domain-containing protein [Cyanobacteria bacterium J06623_4]
MKYCIAVFIGVVIAAPLACLSSLRLAHPSAASETAPGQETESTAQPAAVTFACERSNGALTTSARTEGISVPIIHWNTEAIAVEDTPDADCEASVHRFQAAYEDGNFSHITTGRMDGQLVVCATEGEGERCLNRLLNLAQTQRPRVALQQVLRIRLPIAGGPISDTGCNAYIDLSRYLSGSYNNPTQDTCEKERARPKS